MGSAPARRKGLTEGRVLWYTISTLKRERTRRTVAQQFVIKSNLQTYIPETFETLEAARAELARKAAFARPLVGVRAQSEDTLELGKGARFYIEPA